jgi:hypothetical protein
MMGDGAGVWTTIGARGVVTFGCVTGGLGLLAEDGEAIDLVIYFPGTELGVVTGGR